MGVYVDKFVGYVADVTKEHYDSGLDVFDDFCEQKLSQSLTDSSFKNYYDGKMPSENEITLIEDGMLGKYAKLIFIKSVEYYSEDESEPSALVNEALKTVEVPKEIREKMQKVYSHIFKSDNPIEVYLQEFTHWH